MTGVYKGFITASQLHKFNRTCSKLVYADVVLMSNPNMCDMYAKVRHMLRWIWVDLHLLHPCGKFEVDLLFSFRVAESF